MKRQSYLFDIEEARKAGLTKRELSGLVKAGEIERLARGLYRRPDSSKETLPLLEEFERATLLVGTPSAICLSSALSYYGLCQTPEEIDILVPFQKRTTHTGVSTFRSRNPNWELGIDQKEYFSITTVERTLIDSILQFKRVDREVSLPALQLALDKRITDLHKIISMAGKLRVIHRIAPIISIVSQLK